MDADVPADWEGVELGAIAEAVMGQSPPGRTVLDWDGEPREDVGLPFIQGNAEFGGKFPQPVKWCVAPAKVAQPGDTLISVRAPVGETNRADRVLAIGRGLAAIRFTSADPAFGWHVVNHAKSAFERVAQGSTFDAIGGKEIRTLRLLLPPPSEQRAIATVLDAIDDAIERTEAVIAATEHLREALSHELLTRGVPGGHSEWKQVPGLGTVPACWDVVRLESVAAVQTGRAVNKNASRDGHVELPYLSVANVKDGYLDLSVVKTMHVSAEEQQRYGLRIGDVLFTEGGDADKLGRGAVWLGEIEPCLHQNHVFAVRPHDGALLPEFLAYVAASAAGKRYFLGAAKQTTNLASINSTQLKSMRLPLPGMPEQKRIVEALGVAGASHSSAVDSRERLRGMKAVVADALLTGRLRLDGHRWSAQ